MIIENNGLESEDENYGEELSETEEQSQFPCSIIVLNLPEQLFEHESELRTLFEDEFLSIDHTVCFHYFKTFRRVKASFSTPEQAAEAKVRMHLREINGQILKCNFTQPVRIGKSDYLEPPKREKQFLISPPASPPVGWEPALEAKPILDYDLVNAVCALSPGETHELHPQTDDKPGIFVHICESDPDYKPTNMKLPQTMIPPRF